MSRDGMAPDIPNRVELNDLVNTGVIGLIEAFNNFDPARVLNSKLSRSAESVAPPSMNCAPSIGFPVPQEPRPAI